MSYEEQYSESEYQPQYEGDSQAQYYDDMQYVQPQQQQMQMPMPPQQPFDRGFMHLQLLDSDPTIFKIRCNLLGITQDEKGEWIKLREPLLSIEDINSLMVILTMYSSKNIPLANFDAMEVNKKCFEFCCDVITFLGFKYVGRPDIDNMYIELLVDSLDDTIHSFLTRARDNKEREMIVKTTNVGEQKIIHESPAQKSNWFKLPF